MGIYGTLVNSEGRGHCDRALQREDALSPLSSTVAQPQLRQNLNLHNDIKAPLTHY